ncbi:hypothetical protein ACFQ9Z_35145 [Streptomyces sp. NPDC056580]
MAGHGERHDDGVEVDRFRGGGAVPQAGQGEQALHHEQAEDPFTVAEP